MSRFVTIPDSLFDMAFQFKKEKLWEKLWDSQIFAVKHSDGTVGYCCITGIMKDHFALVNYHGEDGLESYRGLSNYIDEGHPYFEMNERAFSQDCVMLSFENKEYCRQEMIDQVKDYCRRNHKTLRGANSYPNFERYRPACLPEPIMEEQDVTYIGEALDAAMEVAAKLKEKTDAQLGLYAGELYDHDIPLLIKSATGYVWISIPLPEEKPKIFQSAVLEDEDLIARMKKAKKNRHAWVAYIFMEPEDVTSRTFMPDETPDGMPDFPYYLIVVDEHTKTPVLTAMCPSKDKFNEYFTEPMTQAILQHGQPKVLHVTDQRTQIFMHGFTDVLGWKMELEEGNEVLDNMLSDFTDDPCSLEDDDLDDMFAMYDEILEMLSSPATVRSLPDETLLWLRPPLDMGFLPNDVTLIVRNELFRRGLSE